MLLVPTEITCPPTVAWLPGEYVELAITTPPFDAGAAVFPATTTGLGLATTTGLFTAVAGALFTGELPAGAFAAGAFAAGTVSAGTVSAGAFPAGAVTAGGLAAGELSIGASTGETAGCAAAVGAATTEFGVAIRTEL